MSFTRLAVLSVLAVMLFTVSGNATAECVDVKATVGEQTFSTCGENMNHTCIAGPVSGGIKGTYVFEETFGAAFPGGAGVVFVFAGADIISTKRGQILAGERGFVDVTTASPGDRKSTKFTSLLTVSGGTGRYEGASGFLFVSGDNHSLLMHGQLCTP